MDNKKCRHAFKSFFYRFSVLPTVQRPERANQEQSYDTTNKSQEQNVKSRMNTCTQCSRTKVLARRQKNLYITQNTVVGDTARYCSKEKNVHRGIIPDSICVARQTTIRTYIKEKKIFLCTRYHRSSQYRSTRELTESTVAFSATQSVCSFDRRAAFATLRVFTQVPQRSKNTNFSKIASIAGRTQSWP